MKPQPNRRTLRALMRLLSGYQPPRHPKPFAKRDWARRAGRRWRLEQKQGALV